MKHFEGKGVDFKVKWWPYQLNPNQSTAPASKVEMYMKKFGRTREATLQMGAQMGRRFKEVGLPFKFTEAGISTNTFNAHRIVAFAGTQGADVQDAVVEELFRNYFAEEKYLNDPAVLTAAAVKGGIDAKTAEQLVKDEQMFAEATRKELAFGRSFYSKGMSGVPFFILKNDQSDHEFFLSGAQPPEQFVRVFSKLI